MALKALSQNKVADAVASTRTRCVFTLATVAAAGNAPAFGGPAAAVFLDPALGFAP
jgi:hypothetical protein